MPKSSAERFWEKVRKTEGCWEWVAAKLVNGYGAVQREPGSKAITSAQRRAWELTYGAIPPGLDVCHHCDNRSCVRPSHLFLGTRKDNMADAARKRRTTGSRKLTPEQVREIRTASGLYREIAAQFGITRHQASNIIRRKSWPHL